jgi:hypothetical protein
MVVFKCDWTDTNTFPNLKVPDTNWGNYCTSGGLVSEEQRYVMNIGLELTREDQRFYHVSHISVGFYSAISFRFLDNETSICFGLTLRKQGSRPPILPVRD